MKQNGGGKTCHHIILSRYSIHSRIPSQRIPKFRRISTSFWPIKRPGSVSPSAIITQSIQCRTGYKLQKQQQQPQQKIMTKEQGDKKMLNIGFIGLGAMGSPMAVNIAKLVEGCQTLFVYDVNATAVSETMEKAKTEAPNVSVQSVSSPQEMGTTCDIIVTMVPNDKILQHVCFDENVGFLAKGTSSSKGLVHISCSTVHPETSRSLAKRHEELGAQYVGAPVFARADGVAQRQASIVVGGSSEACQIAQPILDAMSLKVFHFGEDPGAGNVVKLCGNYMIAAAIQSSAEALSLAEKSGLDRVAVMEMLTSTIFDCLIYKGYGMRTAHRQHIPNQPMVGPGFNWNWV